jgi:hypothetical protein
VKVASALLVAMTASCGAEPQLLTFDQYMAQCEAMKGKPVRVAGYIDTCAGYDCLLFANQAHAQAFGKYIAAIRDLARENERSREEKSAAIDRLKPGAAIGIGSSNAFDGKAARFQHSYVVISGTVDPENCTGEGGLDRSFGVMPTDIRAWTSSEGATAQTK